MTNQLTDNKLIELMHAVGLRPSIQRIAILDYVANERTHPTSDEIFNALVKQFPSMSRTTVYNSLHALVDCGLLVELQIEAGNMRYDLKPQPQHCHFMCRKCGRIIDLPYPVEVDRVRPEGFAIDSVEISFRGMCPQCNNI